MLRTKALLTLFLFALTAASFACAPLRPIQKGDTVRCPSCGAEFTVEKGLKEVEKGR